MSAVRQAINYTSVVLMNNEPFVVKKKHHQQHFIGTRVYCHTKSVHFVSKLLVWQAAILVCVLTCILHLNFSGWVLWCWLGWSCTKWKLGWCNSSWSSPHQKPTGTCSVLITHKLNQPPAQQRWIWCRHLPGDTDISSRISNWHLKIYIKQEQIIGISCQILIKHPKMPQVQHLINFVIIYVCLWLKRDIVASMLTQTKVPQILPVIVNKARLYFF